MNYTFYKIDMNMEQ